MGSVSCVGLFTPGFYHLESANWQAQSIGQDIMDLFVILPVLLVCAARAYGRHRMAKMIWAGTNVYLVYTFAIYAFDVHFNSMFFFYCLCLGISFYSLFYFFFSERNSLTGNNDIHVPVGKLTGIYFIVVAGLFYALWLSDVIPAIFSQRLPENLLNTGLPTNPVHVIDLAIILPGIFITGIMLLKKQAMGYLLAPVMLVFTLLMNITIAGLNVVMMKRGIEANGMIAIFMLVLAIFNLILIFNFRNSPLRQTVHHAV